MSVLAIAAIATLTGCSGGSKLPVKSSGSAVWVSSASKPIEVDQMARLRSAGIAELFVPAGKLDLDGDEPIQRLELPEVPPSSTVTLVVGGDELEVRNPAAAGERIAASVQQLRFDVEAKGLLPVGVHLDLRRVDSLAEYAALLEHLRDQLDPTLYLSVSLEREWPDRPGIEDVAAAVDFVVPFLYGQRPDEKEAPEAWNYLKVREGLRRLDEIGAPYFLGIVTLGTVGHQSGRKMVGHATRKSLREFLWNRTLRLRPGFSLEGMNRRVYTFTAGERTAVGDWKLDAGDVVRVVRIATSDLEELLAFVDLDEHPKLLGQVLFRLPAAEEQLSLSLDNLINAYDKKPTTPDLALVANPQRRFSRGWLFRFGITNLNGELTELSLMENNFIQIKALNGAIGSVQVGDFYRFDLFQLASDGTLVREFRDATVLRLHIPMLDGGQTVMSGDVQILSRDVELELQGQFLLPDGRTVPTRRYRWTGGELVEKVPEPAPSP